MTTGTCNELGDGDRSGEVKRDRSPSLNYLEKIERTCPNCGAQLDEEKCKLKCPRCSYFKSCSDF